VAGELREQLFRSQTVGDVVRMLGGRVAQGLDPQANLATLRLFDLLRLLTVRSLTDYVAHLVAAKASDDRPSA
jgi:hypothetical protein